MGHRCLLLALFCVTAAFAEPVVVSRFDQPLRFSYGTWEKHHDLTGGRLTIRAADGKGGCAWGAPEDCSAWAERVPALRLRVNPGNQEKVLALRLGDRTQAEAVYDFMLPAPSEEVVTLLPASLATLGMPDRIREGSSIDLAHADHWQLVGDWGTKPLDVTVEQVLLFGDGDHPDVAKARQVAVTRAEAQKRQAQQQLEKARASVTHTPQSPWVERVYTVAPDVLAISIRARRIAPGHLEPYVAQPGDKVIPKDHRADLQRGGKVVAKVIGPKLDTLVYPDVVEGDNLLEVLAGLTETWSLQSAADPHYSTATAPLSVGRKSKPMDWKMGGWINDLCMRHIVYLKLPQPLVEGVTYQIDASRINLRTPMIEFRYVPRTTWSEAVHDCQIGFRPDDPVKRGFVSVWLGSGGAQSYPDHLGFAVLDDASGQEVYRGKLAVAMAADGTEQLKMNEPRNWSKTAVLRADFAELKQPGTYRLFVDGVGCSYPFRIAEDVWEKAFLVQMRGFYNQRSGMELGPPYSDYKRPRDFHPADGQKVRQSTWSVLDGGNEWELAKHGTDELVPNGWGGWHDAGDWNPRRMTHLRNNVDLLLELLLMAPDYFGKLDWPLPPDHKVPAMLNEILWETECFRRLQRADGSLGFGMETEADPRDGEVSWRQTMDVFVYAPDPWSSFIYTSIAARLAFILERYDQALAATYRESALRAMAWAEAEWPKWKDKPGAKERWQVGDDRNFAALELYRLTSDRHWHDIFLQDTVLTAAHPELNSWGRHIQMHQAFGYCLLPDKLADAELKKKARDATLQMASRALYYAQRNAFNITTSDYGRPMFAFFFSVPLAADLVRAHYLTKGSQYLSGIVQACLFPGGANPENATFTVGVGTDWPHNPLKVDARLTGQTTPLGQTVFGPFDYIHINWQWLNWPLNTLLSHATTPAPYQWPVPEGFYDIWIFVGEDEYTVEGFGQNAYVWGYLASRK